MQSQEEQPVPRRRQSLRARLAKWGSGLQLRMILSFVAATIMSLLLLEVVAAIIALIAQRRSLLAMVASGDIFRFVGFWLFSGIFWGLIAAPAGVFLGVMTTRGIVRRMRRLVRAAASFAEGDYSQRVPGNRADEIGQLEQQFNSMAQQLNESIARQKVLAEQNARLEERARIEQELHTARYIQRSLLPREVPALPGWQLEPFYQPAREVGGDFYDFLRLDDGLLGLVIGDVSGKGVPAALVMATTCTMLRAAAQSIHSPGEVLARVNELLCATIPSGIFVTCFFGVLDVHSGRIRYANAGHDWPYRRYNGGVAELKATGMPLGMLPGSAYDEHEDTLGCGESVLFYSDGLVEAHNATRAMFGLPYLKKLLSSHPGGTELVDYLRSELASFTGSSWEQEDDVTLVALYRAADMH